jgi:hypothetical protein
MTETVVAIRSPLESTESTGRARVALICAPGGSAWMFWAAVFASRCRTVKLCSHIARSLFAHRIEAGRSRALGNASILMADVARRCTSQAVNVRTGTWPSQSRSRTAEKAAATMRYTSRALSAAAGSETRRQSISAARTAAWLAGGSNEISSGLKPSGRVRLHTHAAPPAD